MLSHARNPSQTRFRRSVPSNASASTGARATHRHPLAGARQPHRRFSSRGGFTPPFPWPAPRAAPPPSNQPSEDDLQPGSHGRSFPIAPSFPLYLYLAPRTLRNPSGDVEAGVGRPERSRGGRAVLRPDCQSRACLVDRPPALFSNAVEESEALASLHSQAGREKTQGRGAEASAYPRRLT